MNLSLIAKKRLIVVSILAVLSIGAIKHFSSADEGFLPTEEAKRTKAFKTDVVGPINGLINPILEDASKSLGRCMDNALRGELLNLETELEQAQSISGELAEMSKQESLDEASRTRFQEQKQTLIDHIESIKLYPDRSVKLYEKGKEALEQMLKVERADKLAKYEDTKEQLQPYKAKLKDAISQARNRQNDIDEDFEETQGYIEERIHKAKRMQKLIDLYENNELGVKNETSPPLYEWVNEAAGILRDDCKACAESYETLRLIVSKAATPLSADNFICPKLTVIIPPVSEKDADLSFVVTGDLETSLLQPLIMTWVCDARANGGLALTRQDVQIKAASQGTLIIIKGASVSAPLKNPEQLVIYIEQAKESGTSVFNRLFSSDQQGDILMTGRKLPPTLLNKWVGAKRLTRDDCTRLCSDALLFITANKNGSMPAEQIIQQPLLFYPSNSGEGEAASIFDLSPKSTDKSISKANSAAALVMQENPNHIVLGAYHKQRETLYNNVIPIGLPSYDGKDCKDEYSRLRLPSTPPQYAPNILTICSGDYSYSYHVNLFRIKPNAIGQALREYMTKRRGAAQETVAKQGFVPLSPHINRNDHPCILTDSDLPIKLVIQKFNSGNIAKDRDMGYTAQDDRMWGIKIQYPIHFNYNDSQPLAPTSIDDNELYSLSNLSEQISNLMAGGTAAIVLVGHADERGGVKGNEKLSSRRANEALKNIVLKYTGKQLLENGTSEPSKSNDLIYPCPDGIVMTLGCSCLRPKANVNSNDSESTKELNWAKNRRVEMFIIWPKTGGTP